VKKAIITLQKEGKIGDVVAKSLLPETHRNIPRTDIELREDDNEIRLEIYAKDINALRAAINSYLRWMRVSIDTYIEAQGKSKKE
jgi:tRNA threonylcarbamoyladenosine modification (KEOPS) complex  Pcc1 subunit